MTRDRNPSVAVMQRAYGVLDKYKISRTFFLKTDQKDCARGGIYEQIAATTEGPRPEDGDDEDDERLDTKKIKKQLNVVPEHILNVARNEEKTKNDAQEKYIPVVVKEEKKKA